MKILIARDDSDLLLKILLDLKRAGLPDSLEAVVLSVADVVAPPSKTSSEILLSKSAGHFVKAAEAHIRKEIQKAQALAAQAVQQLRKTFPGWKLKAEAVADSPAWAIIKKAEKWKADLIVVGSHGRTAVGELIFGSVAQKVVAEAPCSVRVLHGRPVQDDSPSRLVAGLDGSKDSGKVIQTMAGRKWTKGTAVHLITVIEHAPLANTAALKRMLESAEPKLRKAGLAASSYIKEGNPKHILVEEAKAWGADTLFVGARGLSAVERFLIGSVSMAVAGRAACSVEIVR